MGKPKMTKQFEFENPQPWNLAILGNFQILKFKFFCHFWFPIKKQFFFLKANILLFYQKTFWADIINKKEDILLAKR